METSPLQEGSRLLQAGDMDGALARLRQAVEQNPADGRARGVLGICLARRGELAGSIDALQEAARLLPGDAAARYNLATALAQAGRTDEARAQAGQALALNAAHAPSRQLLERLGGASAAASFPAAPPAAPAPAGPAASPFGGSAPGPSPFGA